MLWLYTDDWLMSFNAVIMDGLGYQILYSVSKSKKEGSRSSEGSLLPDTNNKEIIL